jgi:hypothetical protein
LIVCSPRNSCTASIPDFAELIYVIGTGIKEHPDDNKKKIMHVIRNGVVFILVFNLYSRYYNYQLFGENGATFLLLGTLPTPTCLVRLSR